MATSVHIPKGLLEAVDRKARALEISRNRLIIKALERELSGESGWTPGFFDRLLGAGPELARDVDEMLVAIRKGRRSKSPPEL